MTDELLGIAQNEARVVDLYRGCRGLRPDFPGEVGGLFLWFLLQAAGLHLPFVLTTDLLFQLLERHGWKRSEVPAVGALYRSGTDCGVVMDMQARDAVLGVGPYSLQGGDGRARRVLPPETTYLHCPTCMAAVPDGGLPAVTAAEPLAVTTGGPGTELKKLLSRIGIHATPNCSCNKRARHMDEQGSQWVLENLDTVVGWLREEAEKRRLPFSEAAARQLVRLAVRRAGTAPEGLPRPVQ